MEPDTFIIFVFFSLKIKHNCFKNGLWIFKWFRTIISFEIDDFAFLADRPVSELMGDLLCGEPGFVNNALLLVQMSSLNGGEQEYVYIYIYYSLKQMI